jgi:dTMP kinase
MFKPNRPYFIVIEGINGAGKSSVVEYLTEYLKEALGDERIVATSEPRGTKTGKAIQTILDTQPYLTADTQRLLFEAARLEHCRFVLDPAIAMDKVILCDRYEASTYAYQIFTNGSSYYIDAEPLPSPDLILFLDVQPAIAIERIERRVKLSPPKTPKKSVNPTEEFLGKVREGYLNYFAEYCESNEFSIINADTSQKEVNEACLRALLEFLSD